MFLRAFLTGSEAGQSLTEYSMILLFVAVVAVTVVTSLGAKVTAIYSNVTGTY
jgi:Flp pilus assembly pilin Flp